MNHRLLFVISALVAPLALAGCVEELPTPDYSSEQGAFDRSQAEPPPALDEPDPFVDGERRLVVSRIFNETDGSDFVEVSPFGVSYFIFDNGSGQNTYAQQPVEDRVEGQSAQEFILEPIAENFGWGGGFVLASNADPIDLTPYDVIVVYLNSETITDTEIRIADTGTRDDPADPPFQVGLLATDFGFEADGEWHEVRIPLSAFRDGGVDLSSVEIPFAIGGGAQEPGQSIIIDYLYWERE